MCDHEKSLYLLSLSRKNCILVSVGLGEQKQRERAKAEIAHARAKKRVQGHAWRRRRTELE